MKGKLKYILSIILSTISLIFPFLAILLTIYMGIVVKSPHIDIYYVLIVASIVQYFILKNPLHNMYNDAIQESEYDEFGRSKKKSYKNLTRAEREQMDLQKTADMERLLSSSILKKITKKGSVDPEGDLNKMIGLNPVKEKMQEMVARMKFEKSDRKRKKSENSISGRHMVFYGTAGTGKTTVARILTGFLYKLGYIKKNKCIEIDGNFLKCGSETATKTKMIIQAAYDGVLFIDEAYSLADTTDGSGEEAIATIIKEMEDNRDRFILILAGYRKEMDKLLSKNSGFASRIKEYLDFPDYSIQEMCEIFRLMAHEQGFAVSGTAIENLEIRLAKELERKATFGNGRTVRNILDESIDKHALNFEKKIIGEDKKYTLTFEDISTTPKKQTYGIL